MAQSYQNYRNLIQGHYEDAKENGDKEKEEVLEELLDIYDSLSDFDGILELVKNRNELEERQEELQERLDEVMKERQRTALSGHSLEEFVGQVLKDTANHFDLELKKGRVPAWLGFSPKSLQESEFVIRDFKMNADVAIGKTVELEMGGEEKEIFVPLVYVECKAKIGFYMLKEMAQEARDIKKGNPNALFLIVGGRNVLGQKKEELINMWLKDVDGFYVLRGMDGSKDDPYDVDIVKGLRDQVYEHLAMFRDEESNLEKVNPGT